jgi:hypothetical protein
VTLINHDSTQVTLKPRIDAMTDDEIALRSTIIGVLVSEPIWKIDFWLGPVHVDGVSLFQVVCALNWGYIGVKIDHTSVAGAAAEYHSHENTYVFPYKAAGLTPQQKMAVVHESVHAMLDIRAGLERSTFSVLQTENEAAAYVTQALYGVLAFDATPGAHVQAFYDKAFEIANKIKGQLGVRVDAEDAKYMKHAVAMGNIYYKRFTESTPAFSDGVY